MSKKFEDPRIKRLGVDNAAGAERGDPSCGLLSELAGEARTLPVPDLDWTKVDEALFARVEGEAAHVSALAAYRGRPSPWVLLGCVAGIAAAGALMIRPSGVSPAQPGLRAAALESSAGDLVFLSGAGDVLIDGAKARTKAEMRAHAGESIKTRGTTVAFESSGRVSWLLEDESKVDVERAGGEGSPLVLALERGAIEAQVTPVTSGEAFAVDVAGVRIAVHGTHLRVARDGDRVTIDLTEGVVSIGARPKMGATYGVLVTAPAHTEFQAGSLQASLIVDHDAAAVRKSVNLRSMTEEGATLRVASSSPPALRSEDQDPEPSTPARTTGSPRPTVVARNPNAEEVIQSAVRACASAATLHSSDLRIIQNSTLTIVVQDDGFAHNANFDPPMPDLQDCAARSIWATRFVDSGPHKIEIAVER
jgi:ferric-dicitrate binding protein FerR (iron transport regulator)